MARDALFSTPIAPAAPETAYWLAFPEARRNVPKIKAFRDWILGEIGKRRAAGD